MLQEYKSRCCCIVDNGLFVSLAELMAKHFGKVYYATPWVKSSPTSNSRLPGYGLPGVTRCNDIWKIKNEVDLWIMPDIYYAGLQYELRSQGKRVWGSGFGEELELCRKESKEYLKKLGIPVGKYEVIVGIDKLRAYLKTKNDVWVKISLTRGDCETFKSINYRNIEPRLDELEHSLGAKKKIMEFIVEDNIPDAAEIGFDGYCIDGQFPKKSMVGIETKDKGYIGVIKDYKDMPKQILDVNSKLSDTLKKYQYRNSFCLEMRITKDGTGWVIDPLCRFGSPPGELIQLMYTNLPDIFWFGAEGKCIDPIPAAKFGAELLIYSDWAETNWQPIRFPKEIKDNIKLKNLTIIDGENYVIPLAGCSIIGAVVAVGNTMDEAVKKVKELSHKIEGYSLDVYSDSLDNAGKEFEHLKKFGINLLG